MHAILETFLFQRVCAGIILCFAKMSDNNSDEQVLIGSIFVSELKISEQKGALSENKKNDAEYVAGS